MARDDDTFKVWVADHGGLIARIASTYERRPALVEELVQDVLVAIWRAQPSFRGQSSVRTFVARIAHNVCVSHVRRADTVSLGPLDETIPDHGTGPELDVDARLKRDKLLAAIHALPVALRQTMSLHLEGFSGAEIGEALSVTENNVGVRLARARATLQQSFGGSRS